MNHRYSNLRFGVYGHPQSIVEMKPADYKVRSVWMKTNPWESQIY